MSRRIIGLLVGIAAAVIVTACDLAAQVSDGRGPLDVLREGVRSGWFLKVTAVDGEHSGRAARVTEDSVWLVGARMPVRSIQRLEKLEKSGSGGLPGALLGAAVLGGFGILFVSAMCESSDCTRDYVQIGGAGVLIGSTVGGIIGTVAQPPRRTWILLWPRGDG